MSQVVLEAIDIDVAILVRDVEAPTGALGYGREVSCIEDLLPDLGEVDAVSWRGIGEATIRRLTTARGMLPEDPNYGLDVRMFLNRAVPRSDLRDVAGQIRLEVTKDDRIESASVGATTPDWRSLHLEVRIVPASALGPFSLVFAVTDSAVLLEAIG